MRTQEPRFLPQREKPIRYFAQLHWPNELRVWTLETRDQLASRVCRPLGSLPDPYRATWRVPRVRRSQSPQPEDSFGPACEDSSSRAAAGRGFRPQLYVPKWTATHWRLVSLVEIGIPPGFGPAVKAANQVLEWLTGKAHPRLIKKVNGLTRRCASQEGNALAVCSRLGLAGDPRAAQFADWLVEWQWPDGGWNCDKRLEAAHSSFYESLPTLWGLVEYQRATGDKNFSKPVERASELFLQHRIFRSDKTREVINPEWLKLHYPASHYYDILQALTILSRAGKLNDLRAKEALDLLEDKRGPDDLWRPEGYHWHLKKRTRVEGKMTPATGCEVVDWGRNGPNRMITVNALRVLKAAGRTK